MTHRDPNLIDLYRTACLCDVGQPEYLAATAVGVDGSEHLLLARRNAIGDPTVRYDRHCADVAHEQTGPLPATWRHRTALAPLRCGRSTKTGRPCRSLVAHPGGACGWHTRQAAR